MIKITHISDNEFHVNGKRIFKTMDNSWICLKELTAAEEKAMRKHLESLNAPNDFRRRN